MQSTDQVQPFAATMQIDEGAYQVIVKGLNKLTVEEAGDLCFLFKHSFHTQRNAYLESLKGDTPPVDPDKKDK